MGIVEWGRRVMAGGPDLVTIPNVPIISTGIEYPLATGPATFTQDDLEDAVRAAEEDPHVQHPRLKLAYGGPHDEAIAEPAFGKVVNLRLGDNEQTIYGDYVGVPRWLAEVMPTAYPARSVEANRDCKTVGGNTYRLVISDVALLGVHLPGITSLPDLAAYYGASQPDGAVIDGLSEKLAASGVAAAVNIEDVRRKYYESLKPEQSWWWVRAMELEASGGYLIVDNDEGDLYKVGFTIDGEEVEFAEAKTVRTVYEDVPKDKVAASVVAGMADISDKMTVYATRAESRPTTATKEGGVDLDPKAIAKRLGLPEDATEEQINAKLDEVTPVEPVTPSPGTEPGGPAGPPAGDPVAPEGDPAAPRKEDLPDEEAAPNVDPPQEDDQGNVKLDKAQYEELIAAGRAAQTIVANTTKQHRDTVVSEAVKAGKIAPASRDRFIRLYEADPEGTEKLLTASVEEGGLAAGLLPVNEKGTGGTGDNDDQAEGLPEQWFGNGIAAAKKRADQPSRVTMAREG